MGSRGCRKEETFWWRFVVSTSVKLWDPHKAENFFTSSVTTGFLRRAPVPRIFFGSTAPRGIWPIQCRGLQSHSATTHSVVVLWTSDRPVAETSTRQHTTLTTDIYVTDGIRTINPSK